MKKARMITVCVLLLLSLAACGGKTDGGSEQLITRAAEEAVPVQTEAPAAAQTEASAAPANLGHYAFVAEGVNILRRLMFSLPKPFGAAMSDILSPGTILVWITAGVLLPVFLRSSGSPTMLRRSLPST